REWVAAKIERRKEVYGEAVVEREEQPSYESHVMMQRKPRNSPHAFASHRKRFAHTCHVHHEPLLADHDSSRATSAAACELYQSRAGSGIRIKIFISRSRCE